MAEDKVIGLEVDNSQADAALRQVEGAAQGAAASFNELSVAIEKSEKAIKARAQATNAYNASLRATGVALSNFKTFEDAASKAVRDSKVDVAGKITVIEDLARRVLKTAASEELAAKAGAAGYRIAADAIRAVVSARAEEATASQRSRSAAEVVAAAEARINARRRQDAWDTARAMRDAAAAAVFRPATPEKSAAQSAGVFAEAYREEWQAADQATAAVKRRMEAHEAEIALLARWEEAVRRDTVAQQRATEATLRAAAADAELRSSAQTLVGTYAPLNAELAHLTRSLEEMVQLERLGAISTDQLNEAKQRIQSRLTAVEAGLQRVGTGARFSAYGLQNMSYQVNDLATQLASGTPPLQAFAQQGGQIFQILQMEGVRIGGLILGLGGLAAMVGTVVAANFMHASSTQEVNRALALNQGASGQTAEQTEALAQSVRAAGDISIREARSLQAAFLSAGRVTGDALRIMTENVRDFSQVFTDGNLEEGGEMLARIFRDPLAETRKLDEQLNVFTTSQIELVRQLTLAGDRSAAFQVVMDALAPTLNAAAKDTNLWTSAINGLSNAFDDLGRTVTGFDAQPLDEQLRILEGRLLVLQRNPLARVLASDGIPEITARIEALRAKMAEQESAARRAGEANKALGEAKVGLELARDLDPSIKSLEELQSKALQAAKAFAAMALGGNASIEEMRAAAGARDAYTRALNTFMSPGEKAVAIAKAEAEAQRTNTMAARERLAVRLVEIDLAGQAVTAEEAQMRVDAARIAARSATETAIRDQRIEIEGQAVNSALAIQMAGLTRERALIQQRLDLGKITEEQALQQVLAIEDERRTAEANAARERLALIRRTQSDKADAIDAAERAITEMTKEHEAQRQRDLNSIAIAGIRQRAQEMIAASRQALAMTEIGLQGQGQDIQFGVSMAGGGGEAQRAAIAAQMSIERQRLEATLANIRAEMGAQNISTEQFKELLRQRERAYAEHAQKIKGLSQEMALSMRATVEGIVAPVTSGIQSIVGGVINQTASLRDLAVGAAGAIATAWINSLIEIGAQWVITALMGRAVQGTTGFAQVMSNAAVAASAAYASTAAIPIVGPALAPAAAATAYGATAAYAPFAAERGWGEVPFDGAPTILHKKEMVLPAQYADPLRKFLVKGLPSFVTNGPRNVAAAATSRAAGAAPGQSRTTHVTIQALDGASVERVLMNNKQAVGRAAKEFARQGGGMRL